MSPKKKLSKLDDDEDPLNKKPDISPEERAKRDQKNWEKTVKTIDKLDIIEQPTINSDVQITSPEFLKVIPNPIFLEMASV